MKIGLNATCFNDIPSGATQRFKGIYRELFPRLRNDEFVVFEPSDCRISSWFDKYENVSFRQSPLSSQSRIQKFIFGLPFWRSALENEAFDVFEGFNFPSVRSQKAKNILTIHDIRYFHMDNGLLNRAAYRIFFTEALAHCTQLITVSESMREEILSIYPSAKVSVVYNGVNAERFQDISDQYLRAIRNLYDLPDQFILSVGHFERRKNYANLIAAIARLAESGRSVYLVIVGNDSGEMKNIIERVKYLRIENKVKIINNAPDSAVACLYKLCELFVFPSVYEGFGVPVIEAMAAGCPIALSDIAVFREITQGQGVYFDPNEPEAIAAGIDTLLSSASQLDRLKAYGKLRVHDFSFEKAAMALEGVYRALV
jgi:glycosyltransferase involved in cell wall biosynthesis